jgi:hypothetical protein
MNIFFLSKGTLAIVLQALGVELFLVLVLAQTNTRVRSSKSEAVG